MATRARSFTYWKSCAQVTPSEVASLDRMTQIGTQVTYRTFRRHVVGHSLDLWALSHRYLKDPRHGLTLKRDWHVAYFRSAWEGVPCYYLVWSAYEMIWRLKE